MKTRQLFFNSIFVVAFCFNASAQATQATNAITSTSYLGTSNNFDVIFKRQAISSGLLSTDKTSFGLNSVAMPNSISFGVGAGQFSSGTGGNTYVGQNAGKGIGSSNQNSGTNNTFIGYGAGINNTTGRSNIIIGANAGYQQTTGNNNIFIGNNAGCEDEGILSGSIFIGAQAGYSHCSSNTLVIDNQENDNPLLWGDFDLNRLKFNAKVGIGYNFGNYPSTAGSVDVSAYNLFVKGGILTEEVRISEVSTWADYVFAKDYKLPTLLEVEEFIAKNGHLPNVPSAKQVMQDGIALGEMAKIQQEKIEELTLYVIEQNRTNEKQAKELEEQKKQIEELKVLVAKLVK